MSGPIRAILGGDLHVDLVFRLREGSVHQEILPRLDPPPAGRANIKPHQQESGERKDLGTDKVATGTQDRAAAETTEGRRRGALLPAAAAAALGRLEKAPVVEPVGSRTPGGLVGVRDAGRHDDHAVLLEEVPVDQGVFLDDARGDARAVEAQDFLPRRHEDGACGPDLREVDGAHAVWARLYELGCLALAVFADGGVGQDLPQGPEGAGDRVADAGVDLAYFGVGGVLETEAESEVVLVAELDEEGAFEMLVLPEVLSELRDQALTCFEAFFGQDPG
ncbi:hypothetical protein VPNG_08370 [Cytospora leucostoma]|uniref:Uncharacterized protein n=1 Tax=Cytospora leucostoma TaxID=1230097 RepID=A0A423W9L9_9PEZI|nr:hypothetical protein VPNG_08370 [Cytospora leucostoma]